MPSRVPESRPCSAGALAAVVLLALLAPSGARAQRALDFPVVSRPAEPVTPLGPGDIGGYLGEWELAAGGAGLEEGGRAGLSALGARAFAYARRRAWWAQVAAAEDGRLAPDPEEPPVRITARWERPVQYDAAHPADGFGAGVTAGGGFDDRGHHEVEALAHAAFLPGWSVLRVLQLEFQPAWVARLRVRQAEHGSPVLSPSVGVASWRWPMFSSDLGLAYALKSDLTRSRPPVSSGIWQLGYTPGADRNTSGMFLSILASYEHPWDSRARSKFSFGVGWMFNQAWELDGSGGD